MWMNLFRLGVLLSTAMFCGMPPCAKAQNVSVHNNRHQAEPPGAYPPGSVQIAMNTNDYDKLTRGIRKYLGNGFYVSDPQCLGGRVGLAEEADRFFEVTNFEKARSIAPGVYFTSGIMLHGGTCQTGVLFTTDMDVVMVSTYRAGTVGFNPSVLSIYAGGIPNPKYVDFLESWASGLTRMFLYTSEVVYPKTQGNDVYDLSCKKGKGQIDVSRCLITSGRRK